MKSFLAIALVAASLLAMPVHASGARSDAYTTATTWPVGLSCTPDCLGTGDLGLALNVGGVNFEPDGATPSSVTVADAGGADVYFTVCQDFNDDGFCGDDGTLGVAEPNVIVCGTSADLATSLVPFSAAYTTSVFVTAFEPSCQGVATSGTVTLTTA